MKREGFFQKELLLRVFVSTLLFGLAAHAYSYFNLMYSHDSLLVYQWSDAGEMIGVGRFLVPVYMQIRGSFYPPFLVGLLSLVFLGGAAYLMLRLLNIKSKIPTVLLPGVLATSTTLTLINATYSKDADTYMLALLLAVAAVCICCRRPIGFPIGVVLLAMSLALYQAFFQVAVFLAMIFVVKVIMEGAQVKKILFTGVKLVAMLLLGLVLYYVALRVVLQATGRGLTESYNGLTHLGEFGGPGEILALLKDTWTFPLTSLHTPEVIRSEWIGRLNDIVLLLIVALLGLLAWCRKVRGGALGLLLAVVLLMPFGMNVVYFISLGMVHSLMLFSLYLIYFFAAMLLEMFLEDAAAEGNLWTQVRRGARYLLPALLCVLIFNNVVFSNQAYLKKDLDYQTTLFTMTRIVDRMEQLEGYVAGQTPVVMVGTLAGNGISAARDGLRELPGLGLWHRYSVTYPTSYRWYFREILAYPINLVSVGNTDWALREEVMAMPVFPAAGSCRMIDGTAISKLS
ncbi:MAG: glucosyltransferase domain-containing protein [Oscillospiraceae bacterium]|nr:glucosyltransferase domain-containing protein [Oscillospiraceae bacterium]